MNKIEKEIIKYERATERTRIKGIIENYECDCNGVNKISGAFVTIYNLKINKHYIYADVVLNYDCDGRKERFNTVSYPISLFKMED